MIDSADKRAAIVATMGGPYAPLGDLGISSTDAAGAWGQYGGVWEAAPPEPPAVPSVMLCYRLYAAGAFLGLPTIQPMVDDMLDFEDIGGIYGSSTSDVMTANVAALNSFLAAEARPAIRFGGPRRLEYQSGRVPGTVYFNASIVISGQKPVLIDGGNSVLQFNTIQGTTPAIELGTGGAGTERTLRDFRLQSNGSGIRCDAPGRGTRLTNIRCYPTCAGVTTLDHDGWTDRNTAGYGLQILDGPDGWTPDGVVVDGFQIFDSGGHGFLIYDQLNAGTIRGRCHNSAGTGFKGENLNGCNVDVVTEFNYSWGFHLRNCGIGRYSGGLSGGDTDRPSDMQFWCEANNRRGSPYTLTGHALRQYRVTSSGALRISGHTGWSSNKCDVDEGSRMSCIFESARRVDQCRLATAELADNTHLLPGETGSTAVHNFPAVWANPAHRPTVEDVAGEIVITYPAGCFAGASGAPAYWRPWGIGSLFASVPGDVCIFEIEISGNDNLIAWCIGREEGGQARQLSNPCEFQIAPVSGGKVWPGLYNKQHRKFLGRVAIDDVRTDITPAIILWSNGYQDQTGSFPQNQALELTIHAWKFYVHRADGSAV